MKYPTGAKGCLVTLLGALALLYAVGAIGLLLEGSGSDGEPEVSESRYTAPNAIGPAQRAESTLRIAIRAALRDKYTRVRVTRSPGEEARWIVRARFAGSESFTTSLTRVGIEQDMIRAYEAVFTSGVMVHFATMAATLPMIDRFGRESVDDAYVTRMDFSVGERVNWERVWRLDPSHLWSVITLHPELDG